MRYNDVSWTIQLKMHKFGCTTCNYYYIYIMDLRYIQIICKLILTKYLNFINKNKYK